MLSYLYHYIYCQESEKAGLKLSIQKTQDHGNLSHHCLQIEGDKVEIVTDLFSWAPKSLRANSDELRNAEAHLGPQQGGRTESERSILNLRLLKGHLSVL